MRKRTLLVILPVLLILSACGQPVPQEKAAYVGEWRAQTMALLLTQDGTVAYKRLRGGVTTSVNGPLRRFEGDNFIVGVPILSTTFEVSKPPYQEAGRGRWSSTAWSLPGFGSAGPQALPSSARRSWSRWLSSCHAMSVTKSVMVRGPRVA